MKQEELKQLTDSISEKIGEENVGKIADDLGKIISDNSQMLTEIENRDNKITKLEADKDLLTTTNGKLLQQISFGVEQTQNNNKKETEKPKPFSFKSIFDEKGKFKK